MKPEGMPREPGLEVVLLAPANVVHTQRWVEALHDRGVQVVLVTQHDESRWQAPTGVRVVRLPHSGNAGYFLNVFALRRLLRELRPDLLNAHYASGYGTTAALVGFRPWLLSVWGSDVYDFPYEGWLQARLLRRNLRRADAIASTSEAMARQVRRLTHESIEIFTTPFGVDTNRFAPKPRQHRGFVVGTVKTLAPKYGVDLLLRGYAEFVHARSPDEIAGSTLVVVGDGEQRAELEALATTLRIADRTRFIGAVAHATVPRWLNGFDVYVAVSRLDSESFGVAVVEASACALPVLVSDVDGLREVVVDGETGLVLPRDDVAALARALGQLFDAQELRERLGHAGRQRVIDRYEWSHCVDLMLACYQRLASGRAEPAPDARVIAKSPPAAARGVVEDKRVSVIVPCRNECEHIAAFAASALAQALPPGWTLEIVIADGMSDDGTREALEEMAAQDPRVSFVDNFEQIVSSGLNRALAASTGEVVVRMDVHTEYASDYVAQCLAALEATGADNVGGPWHAVADPAGGATQAAVAAAFQSPWVAGGALSRRLDYNGPADTVYLGAWRRYSFDRFGLFDETLVRNQDDEHNLRIVRGGGRLWQSSRIRSSYRPRATLRQVFRQYLQYGYWKPFVMKKHGQAASIRQFVPAAFVLALGVCTINAVVGIGAWPLFVLVSSYAAVVAAMSTTLLLATPQPVAVAWRVPAVIATYHVAYGIGSIVGAFDVLSHRPPSDRFSTLTR